MFKSKYGKKGLRSRQKKTPFATYKQEIVGVVVAALFIFLFLAFVSYNPTDTSWFYFSTDNTVVSNWCGVFGAHIAALFFFLFGSASYIFLLSLLVCTLFLFNIISFRPAWLRLSTLPVFVFVCATLFHVHRVDLVAQTPGGVIGQLSKQFLFTLFGSFGALLSLYVLLWVSMLLVAQVSVLAFVAMIVNPFCSCGIRAVRLGGLGLSYGLALSYRVLHKSMFLLGAGLLSLVRRKKKVPKVPRVPIVTVGKKSAELKNDQPDGELWDELESLAANVKQGSGSPAKSALGEMQEARSFDLFDARDERLSGCTYENNIGYTFFLLRNAVVAKESLKNALEELKVAKQKMSSTASTGATIYYTLPDFSEFAVEQNETRDLSAFEEKCRERGERLEEKLLHFGVKGKVTAIRPGPVITLFEYKPDIDSKISKIISLEDDLAMALTALSIRIIAPIPGRNVIGFEISNQDRQDVYLTDVLQKESLDVFSGYLPLSLGVDITGNPVIQDLVKMPHILVAGSTGSGKSVGLNAMLISLLCSLRPDQLKIILIDPKRLEFAPYADVPHLLFPIVTNPRKAVPVLKWVVQEMEDRYDFMATAGVRNITDYHKLYEERGGDGSLPEMPFIVLIIDELADLMMVAGKDVETHIARTAQMARAAGIHMIVATQRPSVDVLTGVIKVNFPARIAFRVSSKIDSRTIIDSGGAEKLLGRGDMLFLNSGSSSPQRVHGAYVSGAQVTQLTNYLKKQQRAEYLNVHEELKQTARLQVEEFEDELYEEVKNFIKTIDDISISLLQRKYRIGFNRSARLIEKLELDGYVSPPTGGKMRKVIR